MSPTPLAMRELLAVLADPARAAVLDTEGWSQLVALARRSNLLGTLAERLAARGVPADPAARRHLDGARQLAARQQLSVVWEAHALAATLAPLGVPVLLLKGAAYVLAGHAVAHGRMFGDIDLLVPRSALGAVESALLLDGWVSAKTDAYDQRYYREWMHELPPLMHLRRGSVVDIHHTILPLTAANAPDPARILERAQPLAAVPGLAVPAPQDLLAHSITHRVHEGEVDNAWRDLVDIDTMLREFGQAPGFWDGLQEATAGNDLAGPVALGLRLVQRHLGTPLPQGFFGALDAAAGTRWRGDGLLRLYDHALAAIEQDRLPLATQWARWRLYVRAHALRMPLPLLARHLGIKAWKGLLPKPGEPA